MRLIKNTTELIGI